MNPDYTKLSPAQLRDFVHKMLLAIGSGQSNPYGLDPVVVAQLGGLNASLTSSILTLNQSKDAYEAARRARDANERSTATLATVVTRLVLANPGLSDAQLASLGLERRSGSYTKIVPQTPTQVTASVQENENILVRFKRNGNPQGVVFQIEALVDGAWETAAITTAAKAELTGYAPGQAVTFRVVAQKNGQVAPPSPWATIYPQSAPAPALRLAS